jgi:hypothetical protein
MIRELSEKSVQIMASLIRGDFVSVHQVSFYLRQLFFLGKQLPNDRADAVKYLDSTYLRGDDHGIIVESAPD